MVASIVISVCFVVMAIGTIAIAVIVRRAVNTVSRLEERVEPLIQKVDAISLQGKEMSVHFTDVSSNLSTATKHLAESTELIKDEVAELRSLVSSTALVARDKVDMVSRTIDRTHLQVTDTTEFVHRKIVEPAREIAAVMAGVKKGLEVLFAGTETDRSRLMEDDMLSAEQ